MQQLDGFGSLALFVLVLILACSVFGKIASGIYSSKGLSKTSGFWLGFFGGVPGILIALRSSKKDIRPIQSTRPVIDSVPSGDPSNHLGTYNGIEQNTNEWDEASELGWKQKLRDREEKIDEEYERKRDIERERENEYWEAKEQKEREESEYWEEKQQEERERLREEYEENLRKKYYPDNED